jgi:hypothetical protein
MVSTDLTPDRESTEVTTGEQCHVFSLTAYKRVNGAAVRGVSEVPGYADAGRLHDSTRICARPLSPHSKRNPFG